MSVYIWCGKRVIICSGNSLPTVFGAKQFTRKPTLDCCQLVPRNIIRYIFNFSRISTCFARHTCVNKLDHRRLRYMSYPMSSLMIITHWMRVGHAWINNTVVSCVIAESIVVKRDLINLVTPVTALGNSKKLSCAVIGQDFDPFTHVLIRCTL